MKKILLIILITLELSLIKIPNYKELNNLAIIEDISIIHNKNGYKITLKEIIPTKTNEGIDYKYKYYEEKGKNINSIMDKLNNKTKKKLYLNKAKSLTTNIVNTQDIIRELNINPIVINHINN